MRGSSTKRMPQNEQSWKVDLKSSQIMRPQGLDLMSCKHHPEDCATSRLSHHDSFGLPSSMGTKGQLHVLEASMGSTSSSVTLTQCVPTGLVHDAEP